MRAWLAVALALWLATGVCAQTADSLGLKEVVVEGARVVSKADGQVIYPTDGQKEASATVYGVLAKVGLQGLRVDEVMHTLTPLDDRGSVEVRLNGIPATAQDLLRVAPADLLRIEYSDSPGVRHGRDVGRVVNLVVRVAVSGYAAGAHLSNAVTDAVGRDNVYVWANRGKGEVGLDYGVAYHRFGDVRREETARYLMPDNTVRTVARRDVDGLRSAVSHSVGLTYSLRPDSTLALQARLRADIGRTPHDDSRRLVAGGSGAVVAQLRQAGRSAAPVADVFLDARLGLRSRLTVSMAAALDDRRSDYFYDEGSPYAYHLHGRSYRFDGEAVLESRFRPFTASLGLLCSQRYDAADYGGDVAASDRSRTSDVYAFAQLKGRLWRIDYVAGLGMSTYYFRRNASSHRFTLLRPKLTVQYPLARRLKLRYDIELSEYMSRMAATGSAAIMVNSMEVDEGNPGLRPYRRVEQSLRLSYDAARLSASLQATYRVNRDCNMERYSRRTDAAGNTVFVKTQANGGDCSMFYAMGYCRADIVARRLSLTAGGGLYRFINIGADYRHFYTAFNGSMSVAAYFGKLTLTAAADNGWRFMEGESRGRQGGAVYMTVAYRLGCFSLAAYWQHPFRSTITSESTELMNRFVSKSIANRNGNLGNLLGISVSWTMEKGRKYEAISRQGES